MGFIRTSLMQIVLGCFYYTICSTCFGCSTHPSLYVHLPVPSASTFYIAPEDGCVLHPKHVEQIV